MINEKNIIAELSDKAALERLNNPEIIKEYEEWLDEINTEGDF
jgi:hypothetical protein